MSTAMLTAILKCALRTNGSEDQEATLSRLGRVLVLAVDWNRAEIVQVIN